jgi:hypothetical protein
MREKLNKHSKNITSQYGEDGIIEYLINTSKSAIKKSCFEVGAGDGRTHSNTFCLWNNKSWPALLVEANPERYNLLKRNFESYDNVSICTDYLEIRGKNSVDDLILSRLPKGLSDVGVMSIDIDSFDYHIFKNMYKIKPQIVIIEFNNYIPPYIDYFDPEGKVFLRCSAKAIERLANEKGYRMVACTVTNAILLREDCFDPKFHPDMPVEFLFDYNGQKENGSEACSVVFSQMITRFPVFTKKPNFTERVFYKLRGWVSSFLPSREPFARPDSEVIDQLRKSGLHI